MASTAPPERRPSPLLSNNPFRNKISSGPTSPAFPLPPSGSSTNPFLDPKESTMASSFNSTAAPNGGLSSPDKKAAVESPADLFDKLDIKDRAEPVRAPPRQINGSSDRPENVPPKKLPNGLGRMPPLGHRPSHSEEEKHRNGSKPRAAPNGLDIFADPPDPNKLRDRKPRRNSESSVREKKTLDPEDERRREERRRRHERRKAKQPQHRLDIIDKLDVTSIYGMGLFHHDGPFDACNPARNRKNSKQAPMQAFPKDSRNMNLGGSGPNNAKLNLDLIHGTGHDAHHEYNDAPVYDEDAAYMRPKTSSRNAPFIDPAAREPLHGEETYGLGTSTFLEGAPASRAAIQRRESEFEAQQRMENSQGLSRKKSLAQKIGAVRRPRDQRQVTSPEPLNTPTTPLGTSKSESQTNPFFKEFDQDNERKSQQITSTQQQEQQNVGRARAPSSPRRYGLERTKTADSTGEGGESKGARFLNRVKSIKTKRTAPARPEPRGTTG